MSRRAADAAGCRARRELGPTTGVPVIFLTHLAAVLDDWDPRVVDGIAAEHPVITFDNRGVGATAGSTPDTIAAMAKDAVTFIRALGLSKVDLLGFKHVTRISNLDTIRGNSSSSSPGHPTDAGLARNSWHA